MKRQQIRLGHPRHRRHDASASCRRCGSSGNPPGVHPPSAIHDFRSNSSVEYPFLLYNLAGFSYCTYNKSFAPLAHSRFSSLSTSIYHPRIICTLLSRPQSTFHFHYSFTSISPYSLSTKRLSAMHFTIKCTAMALAIAAVTAAPFPQPAELVSDVANDGIGVSPVTTQMTRREPLPFDPLRIIKDHKGLALAGVGVGALGLAESGSNSPSSQ